MYWTVPETCIAVVCARLPTLCPIFTGMSPESVIGSIRSALSLRSLGGSNHSSPHRSAAQKSTAYGSVPGSVRGFARVSGEGGAATPGASCREGGDRDRESDLWRCWSGVRRGLGGGMGFWCRRSLGLIQIGWSRFRGLY